MFCTTFANDCEYVVAVLLNKGAYIGIQSSTSPPEVSYIDPKVLEHRFDKCIDSKLGFDEKPPNARYFIEFDYKNFVTSKNNENNNEMDAIKFIGESMQRLCQNA